MGRLLRLLLGTLAHSLRAIAGRLQPAPSAATPTAGEDAAADGDADGPPPHWLALVRQRAPGLHRSLQERGMARHRAAPGAPPATHSAATPPPTTARGNPPLSAATTRRLPVAAPPASATAAGGPSAQTVHATGEPSAPPRKVNAEGDEEWTRAPTRRLKPITTQPAPAESPAPAVAPATSDADQAATLWRATTAGDRPAAPRGDARSATDSGLDPVDPRRQPTRPILRPLSRAAPGAASLRQTAGPALAPARDEDRIVASVPQPPIRWPSTGARDRERMDLDLDAEEVGSPFPTLPDETPHRPLLRRPGGWPTSAAPAHGRRDPGLAGWPEAPAARGAAPDWADDGTRWPELPTAYAHDGACGLPAPEGHRERLAQEQRGTAWNG